MGEEVTLTSNLNIYCQINSLKDYSIIFICSPIPFPKCGVSQKTPSFIHQIGQGEGGKGLMYLRVSEESELPKTVEISWVFPVVGH